MKRRVLLDSLGALGFVVVCMAAMLVPSVL